MRKERCPLLWLLWDNIRNGQAHQYQQIPAHQPDGELYIALAGADHRLTLNATVRHRLHEQDHLSLDRKYPRALGIKVYPQWIYLDLRDAVITAGLLRLGGVPTPLSRSYDGITIKSVAAALHRARKKAVSTCA